MKKISTVLPRSLNEFKDLQKLFELPIKTNFRYVNGDIYFDEDEIKNSMLIIRNKLVHEPDYPDKIVNKVFSVEKEILKFKEETKDLDIKKLSNEELKKTIIEGCELTNKISGFMSFRGTIQIYDVLAELVRGELLHKLRQRDAEDKLEDYFLILSAPARRSFVGEEKDSLIEIAILTKENENIDDKLKEHIYRFGNMKFHWLIGEEMTIRELKERIDKIKDPISEKEKIRKQREQTEREVQNMANELDFSENTRKWLSQLRMYMFMRTYVKDIIAVALDTIRLHLKEYGERNGFSLDEVLTLTYDEMLNVGNIDRNELLKRIEKRRKSFICEHVDGKMTMVEGGEIEKDSEESETNELKGQIVCKGIVKGIARVLQSAKEINKVQEGDILITAMTTPDFLPAMEKAAAFVTDEGGLTCHAAIVSREMRKPCIVGTLKATKAFKDGDFIEVDANKGVVRKIT